MHRGGYLFFFYLTRERGVSIPGKRKGEIALVRHGKKNQMHKFWQQSFPHLSYLGRFVVRKAGQNVLS